MTLSLASNLASLAAQNSVRQSSETVNSTIGRLSSGLRINSASDDPAGLQVADSLRADARLASVAIRNANDGLSLASIAESAMSEIGNILARMGELAESSSNGVFTNSNRSAMQIEFDALGSEIQRIASVTKFNERELISDNSQNVDIQVGIDSSSDSQISITGVSGSLYSVGLAGSAGSTALTFSLLATQAGQETDPGGQAASLAALSAIRTAIDDISTRQGVLGAAESRLVHAINYIAVARENFIAAESKIRDADIAQEVANLVQAQVIQQAAIAMLAQANQQPGVVLQLLQ